MKPRNILLALQDQLPVKRFLKNLWNGNLFGLFHKRSHFRDDGQAKVTYNTKETVVKVAKKMADKHQVYFSNYKCMYCDGYHIGKNRK
jgi:hypothetical protein